MKHRITWIDFGKGLTIFLVVIAHVLSGIYTNKVYLGKTDIVLSYFGETLFVVIMPVFFSLSGYLFKTPQTISDYLIMVKKKAWNLLTPYVVFSIIYVVMTTLGGDKEYNWHSLLYIWYAPISYLWFLYTLFFIFVLVGFLSFLKLNINIQLLIYFIAFIIIQFLNIQIPIFKTFGWAIFFILGRIFKERQKVLSSKLILCLTLLVSLAMILIMFSCLGTSHALYNDLTFFNFIPKVMADIFMFSLFNTVSNKTRLYNYFEYYGKYSLIIYMVHAPVLSATRAIILKVVKPNVLILVIILLTVGWYISLLVICLSKKSKIINFIFNPYIYINGKQSSE